MAKFTMCAYYTTISYKKQAIFENIVNICYYFDLLLPFSVNFLYPFATFEVFFAFPNKFRQLFRQLKSIYIMYRAKSFAKITNVVYYVMYKLIERSGELIWNVSLPFLTIAPAAAEARRWLRVS